MRRNLSVVAINRAKQLPNFNGISNRRMISGRPRGKSASQVHADVMFRPTGRNRVAKHAADHGADSMSGITQ
jgi:hypothetical protein